MRESDDTSEALRKFVTEVVSVFMRWYEESDLEDEAMLSGATYAIERFFGTDVEFEADPEFLRKLDEEWREDDDGPSAA